MNLIDKDILWDKIQRMPVYNNSDRDLFEDLIIQMPSADVALIKHGKWEQHDEYDEDSNVYTCSVCNEPWCLIEGDPKDNYMNYCPHCGAKMDLKGEE